MGIYWQNVLIPYLLLEDNLYPLYEALVNTVDKIEIICAKMHCLFSYLASCMGIVGSCVSFSSDVIFRLDDHFVSREVSKV